MAPLPVSVAVDASRSLGPLTPAWRFLGYDEPNYTTHPNGRALLATLAAMEAAPLSVRVHNLLTSGDGTPGLKWGSTNVYSEDENGHPVHDWKILDEIFDVWVGLGIKPFVQIGFMPEALSSHPHPYRHSWEPGQPDAAIATGWAYPPRDYGKWRALAREFTRHLLERYGKPEVETWLWEVWNEPDGSYWHGTCDEFCRLYDHAAAGVRDVLPEARIGGPHTTSPRCERGARFLENFLDHCLAGKNSATGETGAPLDFVTFHAKGWPEFQDGHVRMGITTHLKDIDCGFALIATRPELRGKPVIVAESDPDCFAACPAATHHQFRYRTDSIYACYLAAVFARKFALAVRHNIHFAGAVTWSFIYADRPFEGFRTLTTDGIELPVLQIFRMFGHMQGENLPVESSSSPSLDDICAHGIRDRPDVSALACREGTTIHILLWHYHDDDVPGPDAKIALKIQGTPPGTPSLEHFRVDPTTSNSFAAWRALGSPENLSDTQRELLVRAALLQPIAPPEPVANANGISLELLLPRQGVSLLNLRWT